MGLDITGLGGFADIAMKVIDRVIPNPEAKAAAQLELLKLTQSGDLAQLASETQLALGQLEVNKAEAASPSVLTSGWRPAVGWVCAAGLAYQFLLAPLMTWGSSLVGKAVVAPALDMSTLLTLLLGMLGLGGMRTIEKLNSKA